MARFIILLVLLSLSTGFLEAKKKKKDEKKCPTFTNLANFSNPVELRKIEEKTMDALWDIDSPDQTDLGDDFIDILYDMFESRVPFWRNYALFVTEWIWIYLPDVKKDLNLCSYAEIINNTMIFEKTNDCDLILKSMDGITKEFTARGLTAVRNMITNVGCNLDGIPTPNQPLLKCYKDGFVYNIDEIWEEIGWEYPCSLRNIVMKMYKSNDKQDKLMALIATQLLPKHIFTLVQEFDPQSLNQLFLMLAQDKIPKCCCEQFKKEAMGVGETMQKNNVRLFRLARQATNCPTQ